MSLKTIFALKSILPGIHTALGSFGISHLVLSPRVPLEHSGRLDRVV